MNVEFEKGNDKHKKVVEKIIKKIDNDDITIELDDLEYINNFYYSDRQNYFNNFNSKKLNDVLSKIINNRHVNYFFIEQSGMGNQFLNAYGGKVLLFYDGIAYGVSNSNINTFMKKIVYIPDNTEDSPEAYVKAVQDRIDNYFGKDSGVIASYVGAFEKNIIDDILNNEYLDISSFDGNHYIISYMDRQDDFIIIKDSSKIQKSTFTAVDVNNNIIVSSNNANYPTNTVVSSKKIDGSFYRNVLEKLGLKDAEIIDISLYSPLLGHIRNFEDVNFDVSVSINLEKFKSRNLFAYYIDENGNVEAHPILLEDFMANFKTTHFSTYIIAEKSDEHVEVGNAVDSEIISNIGSEPVISNINNPKTYDNIMIWFILCVVSVSLCSALVYKKFRKIS